MQPGLSRKALPYFNKHSCGGILLIQYRQSGSNGSFRAVRALCGTIQSSKICRQHQITKHEHCLCTGTICYHCVLPQHVICQWESNGEKIPSRWTEVVRTSVIECHPYIHHKRPFLLVPSSSNSFYFTPPASVKGQRRGGSSPPPWTHNSHFTISPNSGAQCQKTQSKRGFRGLQTSQNPPLSPEGFPTPRLGLYVTL